MKLTITPNATRTSYRCDCLDLPGTPPVGEGSTEAESVASLFHRMRYDSLDWWQHIERSCRLEINGQPWRREADPSDVAGDGPSVLADDSRVIPGTKTYLRLSSSRAAVHVWAELRGDNGKPAIGTTLLSIGADGVYLNNTFFAGEDWGIARDGNVVQVHPDPEATPAPPPAAATEDYRLTGHKCRIVAKAAPCLEGREILFGELLEPIEGHAHETHCLHVTTPKKSVVFGICGADLEVLEVFAYMIGRHVENKRWLERRATNFANNANYDWCGGETEAPPAPPTAGVPVASVGPRKFRKKPVVIEAVRWDGDSDTANTFIGDRYTSDWSYAIDGESLIIPTLEGNMQANVGDWIIKGVKGEFYPCKPDIFEATYEPAESAQRAEPAESGEGGTTDSVERALRFLLQNIAPTVIQSHDLPGVISQIDNWCAGTRNELAEARARITQLESAVYKRMENEQLNLAVRFRLAHMAGVPRDEVGDHCDMSLVEKVYKKLLAAMGGSSGASSPDHAHAAELAAGNGLPSPPPGIDQNEYFPGGMASQ